MGHSFKLSCLLSWLLYLVATQKSHRHWHCKAAAAAAICWQNLTLCWSCFSWQQLLFLQRWKNLNDMKITEFGLTENVRIGWEVKLYVPCSLSQLWTLINIQSLLGREVCSSQCYDLTDKNYWTHIFRSILSLVVVVVVEEELVVVVV